MVDKFGFSPLQADAIVEMRLRQLTGLEIDKLTKEHEEVLAFIADCEDILANYSRQMQIIKDELDTLKEKFGDERRSVIEMSEDEFNPEDFYPNEDVVITISHLGYIKRTPLAEYRLQNRGGIGSKGSTTREEDFISHIYVANMHSTMLFFTSKGKCYWLKVYNIPEGTKASKGRAIQNIINIDPDDKVQAYMNVKDLNDEEYVNSNFVVLCTKRGVIKKTSLEAYSRPRANGIFAINIREDDALIEASLTNGNSEILLAARKGKLCRFNEDNVRAMGRVSTGVRGINIEEDDEVIGMICADVNSEDVQNRHILVVSEHGFGKRSDLSDYRITNRGGKGVKTLNITDKTGDLIAIKYVSDENDLLIINKSGITIRLSVASIRVAGRATQGVKLINVREGDEIAAVCAVYRNEENVVELNTEVAEASTTESE